MEGKSFLRKQLTLLPLVFIFAVVLLSCTSITVEVTENPDRATITSSSHPTPADFSPIESSIPTAQSFDTFSTSISPKAYETRQILASIDYPLRNLIGVTKRLKHPDGPIPEVVRSSPWQFELGDQHQFWTYNWNTGKFSQISAQLVYATPHMYTFVQDDLNLNEDELFRLIDHFETSTYPTNRRIFGSEWIPGVDNDPHLVILFTRGIGSSYQISIDEYSRQVHPNSNEMEIIYIDAEGAWEGDHCMLAHEFQHVIQWAIDPSEETWLNEGFSVMACQLNGLFPEGEDMMLSYLAHQPDIQLNSWSGEADQVLADFSASYLFLAYFVNRFGEEALQTLVADQANGLKSIDRALESLHVDLDADKVFADWVVANYLNDPEVEDGQYGYSTRFQSPFKPTIKLESNEMPYEAQAEVAQYGADYISLTGEGDYELEFNGSRQVGIGPDLAHSGEYAWWGGRGTNSDTTLTREFDLTGLESATLSFYTWYDIDQDHDYAFVEISKDGEEWLTLPGQNTTTRDPSGFNYGYGYTGASNGWIHQEVDLTPFVGQNVHIRFEYLTDDGPNSPGFFIDDIEIPELGFRDDSESEIGGWAANGFLRSAGILPQEWLLQLIVQAEGGTTVEQLQLNPDNTGKWELKLSQDETAVLVISGLTRGTTEKAQYKYRLKTLSD
jgi:hypothetical protein